MQQNRIDGDEGNRIEAEGRDREMAPAGMGSPTSEGRSRRSPRSAPASTAGVVIDDEEEAARREAVIRHALLPSKNITDATDTDEIWDEVFRGLGETH